MLTNSFMNRKYIVVVISLVVIVGIASFYWGRTYERNSSSKEMVFGENAVNAVSGQRGQGRNADGQRPTTSQRSNNNDGFLIGEILSKDDENITLKTSDGSSKIIYISDSTMIGRALEGSAEDLAVGGQITVGGKTNSDGSVSAQNIQIRSH